jgi:hypothetical protein
MNKSGLRAGLERQTQEQQKEKSLLSAFVTRPTTLGTSDCNTDAHFSF